MATARLRMSERVKHGGHDIPVETIDRRYQRGMINFFSIYQQLCDYWLWINNSTNSLQIIASGEFGIVNEIKIPDLWSTIRKQADAFKAGK